MQMSKNWTNRLQKREWKRERQRENAGERVRFETYHDIGWKREYSTHNENGGNICGKPL